MKLYTEEQVIEMLNRARLHNQDDTEMFSNDYLIATVTPIELPSDEEIKEQADKIIKLWINDTTYNEGINEGFYLGVEFMKEQILNQNNK